MKFQNLCIGDLFNTKSARWVKTEENMAIVVMSAILLKGKEYVFLDEETVILLWSSILNNSDIED